MNFAVLARVLIKASALAYRCQVCVVYTVDAAVWLFAACALGGARSCIGRAVYASPVILALAETGSADDLKICVGVTAFALILRGALARCTA
jgi:hypothetical protein